MTVRSSIDLAADEDRLVLETTPFLVQWSVDGDHERTAHWIIVERDLEAGERHLLVGPYRDAQSAHEAMIDSLLMDSLAEESCLDMYAVSHAVLDPSEVSGHELVLIDENDPAHHARSRGPSSV